MTFNTRVFKEHSLFLLMGEKRDWVKIIAICLAILFFILWIAIRSNNTYQAQTNQDLSVVCQQVINNTVTVCQQTINNTNVICQQSLKNLNDRWQSSFNIVLNCYQNGVKSCQYSYPSEWSDNRT